jgi:hypothetical protein
MPGLWICAQLQAVKTQWNQQYYAGIRKPGTASCSRHRGVHIIAMVGSAI